MKLISVYISDSDYDALVQHLADDRPGRALVAVIGDAGSSSIHNDLQSDVYARRREAQERLNAAWRDARRDNR
jgi:hypothetical protein